MADDLHIGLQAAYFAFKLDGLEIGWFTGASGLGVEIGVIEHDTTDGAGRMRMKIPGRITFSEVTLKRGLTKDMKIYQWFTDVSQGKVVRKTGSIIVYDREKKPKAEFTLDQVFPSKLAQSDMSSKSTEAMIETLTLRHELLKWV